MSSYSFSTDEFGLSDTGIHLLRSGFNYETIPYQEITQVKIDRGRVLNNWFLIFLLGAGLLLLTLYVVVQYQSDPESWVEEYGLGFRELRILSFLAWIPVLGLYFIIMSFKTGLVMNIRYNGDRTCRLPLRHLGKEETIDEFNTFLGTKLKRIE